MYHLKNMMEEKPTISLLINNLTQAATEGNILNILKFRKNLHVSIKDLGTHTEENAAFEKLIEQSTYNLTSEQRQRVYHPHVFLCAQSYDVQEAGHNVIQSAKKIGEDKLGILTSLMSFRLAIDRFYIAQNEEIKSQDVALIFAEISKHHESELNFEHYQKITQLRDHIHLFVDRALDSGVNLRENGQKMEDYDREYLYFLIQNLEVDITSFLDGYFGSEIQISVWSQDDAQEKQDQYMLEHLMSMLQLMICEVNSELYC